MELGKRLNVPVVPMQANKRLGLPELRIAMSQHDLPPSKHMIPLPEEIHQLLEETHDPSLEHARHAALYLPGEARARLDMNQAWEERLIAARYDSIRENLRRERVAS